ncbi:MAG: hypothetical protein ACRD7E_27480 [Bryobacteraceae bacterium]
MTLTTQWPLLSAGARLVAPGTLVPPEWRVESDSAAGRWSRLTTTLDNKQLESQLAGAGWTFFFMATTITTTAFGFSRQRMLDTALERLMAAVTLQKCNCAEIDDVSVRSFLGIPYVHISAHPRHIQKGMVFSGQ